MQEQNLYTEKELLARLSGGDQSAFTQLFYDHKDKLYSYIMHVTGSAAVAEDVLQDVFLKIWVNRSDMAAVDNFGAYLFRMAQNRAINGLRRQSRGALILAEISKDSEASESSTGEDILSGKEVRELLQQALDRLPAQQRRVFEMSRNEGLKYQEIAERLGISPSTVRNHMIQALKSIREFILNTYPLGVIYCTLLLIPLS